MNEFRNVMEMVAAYYRDDLAKINLRLKAFHFHEMALARHVFYDNRDLLALAYRLDHNKDDLFLEARKIGQLIIRLNMSAKSDPAIAAPFLNRWYNIKEWPAKDAPDEVITTFYRDTIAIVEDFETLVDLALGEQERKGDSDNAYEALPEIMLK